ncbi:MAG: OmpA family protein [Bacteroidales bacterium]|nr:OmpA family protein [Bacteroidales bacterium]MBN2757031.1 OmpA family protein [Bacteroidales bacterium]
MKNIILCIILIINFEFLYTQTDKISTLKNWQLKGYAKSAQRVDDYYSEIEYYAELAKRKPSDIKISHKLANLYFKVKNYEKAKNLFYKVYKYDEKKYINCLYYYAQSLKTELKYDTALVCFIIFNDKILNNKTKTIYNYMSHIEIEACNFALKNPIQKENIEIIHLNTTINKIHMESSPVIYNDSTLIYSSVKVDTIPTVNINEENIKYESRFYTAINKKNEWFGGEDAPEPFYNFKTFNTSNGVFSTDKKRFYFTSGKKNWKNQIISSIYVSINKNGKWSKPKKLNDDINFKKYTSTQPAIGKSYNKNYEVLYFISNRPDGIGGMDIWYTVYDETNQIYKKPMNAGTYINTIADELTPFYDNEDSCLYFSSNGRPGYGGFDIYKSKGCFVNWQQSINVGLPINSSYDDIYFCKFTDKKNGFIVSNRDESLILKNPNCCFDIFEFKNYGKNIDLIAEVEKKNIIVLETKKDSSNIIFDNIKTSINQQIINLDKQKNKIKKSDNNNYDNTESIVFNNIYFKYNKASLAESSKRLIDSTLLVIMESYKDIIVEISAHTDYKGSKKFNLELSQNRAQNVVNYLINKGIGKKRLVAVGFGESKPLVKATDEKGNDIPEAREKNRRIEFKIIGLLSKNNK